MHVHVGVLSRDSQTRKCSLLPPYSAFYNCEELSYTRRPTCVSLSSEVLGDRRWEVVEENMEYEKDSVTALLVS